MHQSRVVGTDRRAVRTHKQSGSPSGRALPGVR
jgi:hypothetical protein